MKTRLLIIPAFLVLVGVTLLATDTVDAFGLGQRSDDEVIIKFAEKFGRSEDEVRAVFDELHQDRLQQMQANFEQRLDEAVAAGTISEEQKQLLLEKHNELHQMHQDMWLETQGMTPEERRAIMVAQHDEMESWAEENGIDLNSLQLRMGPGGPGRGMHGKGIHMYQ